MRSTKLSLVLLLGAITPVTHAQPAQSQAKSWTVPWEKTRPRDAFVDQKGRVWFVGQVGNYVAHLDPKSGEISLDEHPQ